jgi:peptide/nickel transport system substrate-binding protein
VTAALLLAVLAAAAPDTLVVGTLSDPAVLAPHGATDLIASEIVANVCETLVRVQPGTLRPEGVLATAWATTDQRVWTLTLREGVSFHDGAAFDADAVTANLDHLRRERGFPGHATRVGPLVVEIALDRPNAALLSTLSQPFFAMQSPRRLGATPELPVGTGPFRLALQRPGLVELAAYDGYRGGPPRLRRVQFRRFPDEGSLATALATGEADVSAALSPERAAELRAHAQLTLDAQPGLSLTFLAINNEKSPLSDAHVRRALSKAIDRTALAREMLAGHAEPAVFALPPTLLGPDTSARELTLDRDAARRLLDDAHVAPGFETTLTVSRVPRPYLLEPLRAAARIKDALAQVGLLGWRADTLDPNDFLTALVDSGSIGTTNRCRYRSPAMDGLLKRARQERAPRSRLALYLRAQELLQSDMPFVPLYYSAVLTAYRREVRGLVIGPTGTLRYDKAWKQP